jgi:hypothetical protein
VNEKQVLVIILPFTAKASVEMTRMMLKLADNCNFSVCELCAFSGLFRRLMMGIPPKLQNSPKYSSLNGAPTDHLANIFNQLIQSPQSPGLHIKH